VRHSYIYIGALLLSVAACSQHSPSAPAISDSTVTKKDSAQKNFFPVADYIRGEIHYVDSMPLAIMKYNIHDGHTDSSFIHSDEFHRIAGEFLLPELEKGNFEKQYLERSFMDETSGFLTFTYSTPDRNLLLQRADVLAIPATTATGSSQVKSIYLETARSSADTLIVKKMLWIARKNLLIVTSLQPNGKPSVTRQLKVIWDNSTDE
jgi:hypothetical protein